MNEPPGARLRVALSGLAITEYFRDEKNQDVLLFIDNIFRFSQAGSEVSALLGRTASAVGLSADACGGDGRAAGAHHVHEEGIDHVVPGGVRAGRRPDGPGAGDDVRAPRRDDRPRALDRRAGHLPGGRSARVDLARARAGDRRRGALRRRARRAESAAALQGSPGHHRDPRHGRVVAGRQADGLPRAQDSALSQPAVQLGPGVHRARGTAGRRSPTRSAASRKSSTANTTRSRKTTST